MVKKDIDHCCQLMTFLLKEKKVCIGYKAIHREYFISLKNNDPAIQEMFYCPWCNKKLPGSLRDKYYEILEKEYNLEAPIWHNFNNLPEEFKTDEWWKKRGL